MSKRILLLAGSLMLCFTLSACGQATVETTTPPPTPTPEVVTTPAPTPKTPDFEEPPVDIVFSGKNDLDGDGIISKSEWDTWVTAHPEDTNQDMVITDAEGTPPVTAPAETPPAETTKPVTPPAETVKPVETPKPVETGETPKMQINANGEYEVIGGGNLLGGTISDGSQQVSQEDIMSGRGGN